MPRIITPRQCCGANGPGSVGRAGAHLARRRARLGHLFLACVVLAVSARCAAAPAVRTGIEVLRAGGFAALRGKRVGLVTNPTGIAADLTPTVDLLRAAPGVKLVALFGPEHGVRGDARAGETVANERDPVSGLPVYSLYGAHSRPTPEMLRNIDVLVYDMQDIGSRSYTYIYTLGQCMEAAARQGIPFVVLDRPNPLGGQRIEGNKPDARRSAVCPFPIPYCHGLTVGELAQMINGRGWLAGGQKCRLTVVPMTGYRRAMTWAETGLPWAPTSPHVPHPDSAAFYAATGIVGELPTLSIGVGYTLPFELAGAPGVSPVRLCAELRRRGLAGLAFRAASWRPFYAAHQGESCGGVQIYVTDPQRAELTRLNFELIDAVRTVAPGVRFFGGGSSQQMFDMVCGTPEVRRMLSDGRPAADVWRMWNAGAAAFRQEREQYLLYP